MLTLNQIKDSIEEVIKKYPVKKVSIFGSYAQSSAKEDSDIDLLVEFASEYVSLIMLSELKSELEDRINREVDLIHGPLDDCSIIQIDEVIDIYEAQQTSN